MYNPIVAIIGFGRAGKIHYQNLKEMNINIKYLPMRDKNLFELFFIIAIDIADINPMLKAKIAK